jgi:ATP-dependent DNA ligase
MIQPMLAQKAEHPQSGEEWLAELKLDGIRLLYSTDGGRSAWTRHGTPCLSRFPELEHLAVLRRIDMAFIFKAFGHEVDFDPVSLDIKY